MGDVDLLKKEERVLLSTTLQNRAIIIGKKKTEVRILTSLTSYFWYVISQGNSKTVGLFTLSDMI